MNPVVTVLDQSGRQVASSDRRGWVDFRVPSSGPFLIRVHDLTFSGGADYFYRLSVDQSPILESVLPFALEPGKKNKLMLLGRGLPGSRASAMKGADGVGLEILDAEVDVPQIALTSANSDGLTVVGAAGVPSFSYRFSSENGVSNPLELPLLTGARSTVAVDAQSAFSAPGSGSNSRQRKGRC